MFAMSRGRLRGLVVAGACAAAALSPSTLRADPPMRAVAIAFRAVVGERPFACGQSYAGIGIGNSTFTPSEFRMFVHDVHLVTRSGQRVPLTLEQDGRWQNGDLAMLDFEDGSGPCSNGSPDLRTTITGTAPEGEYVAVEFQIGVPFARNHGDLAAQPAPLSVTRMFWSWNSGHKFIRLDGRTATNKNWVLHLGSTGCTPSDAANAPPTSCAQRNAVPLRLAGFDPARDEIVADVAALYRESNLEDNQPQTAAGCMSGPTDRDCGPIFRALGLPFADAPATPQSFLRVERRRP
jgi:uncharacterized repeat protein (TIGR04052 family)